MKTIVINTSKALQTTELDILFKAPYNPQELIWYDIELNEIGSSPNEIKAMLTQEDIIVTAYNLFVIVDFSTFPRAGIRQYSDLYQSLLEKYIEAELLKALGGECKKANICFLKVGTTADNEVDGDASFFVRFLKNSFGWENIENWDHVNWKFRYSSEELYIDFSNTFSRIREAKHDKKADLFLILKTQMKDALEKEFDVGFAVKTFSFTISQNNDAELYNDLFSFLANVFRWIKSNKTGEIRQYSVEDIRVLMTNGRKKCQYYSDEDNYKDVKYYSILPIVRAKAGLKTKWKEKRKAVCATDSSDGSKPTSIDTWGKGSKPTKELHNINTRFTELKKAILRNYDSASLAEENKNIIISNINKTQLYRKKITEKDIIDVVNGSIEGTHLKTKERESLGDADFGENGYNELIGKITQAEIDFFGNDNILHEVEDAQVEFDDLTRKGKLGLISLVGGILSFFAALYPFLEIRSNIKLYGEVDFLFILPVVGIAAAIYAFSAGVYTTHIHREKLGIIHTLENLKNKSEESRKKSINAFRDFCEETLPDAELYLLISRELKRRDEENAKTAKRLNNHIKRFRHLNDLMNNYFTKMRLDYVETAPNEDSDTENEYPAIDVEKDFYDQNNAEAYCIIDFDCVEPQKNEPAEAAGA